MNTKIIFLIPLFVLFSFICGSKWQHRNKKNLLGKKAIDFALQDENEKLISLKDFNGQKIVLFFYPKDGSKNCTSEACSFRDNSALYKQHNIVVLGISYDSPMSHAKFKEDYHLNFSLLSDTNHKVSKAYGVNKGLTGAFIPNRKTFLIDEKGVIVYIFDDIDIATHAIEVLEKFNIDIK